MKSLELLRNQENIFPEELQSKKNKPLAKAFAKALSNMDEQIKSFTEYRDSQIEGDLAGKIIVSKSLAEFFANNKILRVDLIADYYRNEEKIKLNQFYATKTKLLDILNTMLKESHKEAIVSTYDVFEGDFQKCESGHEVIILNGRNTDILSILIEELDKYIVMSGNFDNLDSQDVDFNTEVLDRNVSLCNRKNEEINGTKSGKFKKTELIIKKLEEIGKQVVAFYTYKDTLLEIGCNKKNIKLYENELSKAYIPLKKTLQKEFRVELEDICDIVVNEEEYSDSVEEVEEINSWETESDLTEDVVYNEPTVQEIFENEHIEEPNTSTNPFLSDIIEEETEHDTPVSGPQSPFLNEYRDIEEEIASTSPFLNETTSFTSPFLNPIETEEVNNIEHETSPFITENYESDEKMSPDINNNMFDNSPTQVFNPLIDNNSVNNTFVATEETMEENPLPPKKNMFED